MMMKNPLFAPHGLALVGLTLVLAGCPALDTLTLSDPKATPSPSASTPAGDPDKDEDPKEDPKEPAFAIKALGPVRAQLLGAFDVEQGPFTVQLHYSHDKIFHQLGVLGTLGTTPPEGTATRFDKISEEAYELNHDDGEYYFRQVDAVALVNSGELALKVGDVAPTHVRAVESEYNRYFLLTYPPSAQGDLVATPADSSLSFQTTQDNGYTYRFPGSVTLPLANLQGFRSATVSATVSVQELDGTPSTGLTAANFRLSGGGRIAIQATETEAGRYRVVMALDELDGPRPQAQRRMLTVTHATLTHTHGQPTPPSEQPTPPSEQPR